MQNTEPDFSTDTACTTKVVHVSVAVIEQVDPVSNSKKILIAKRPDHVHQGGFWEFPGGKVEKNEPVLAALQRELFEELDITIPLQSLYSKALIPLIQIKYRYPEKTVWLDVWRVREFSGLPRGKEGQEIRWVALDELVKYQFPPANKAIVNACLLPSRYFITPAYASLLAAEKGLREALNQSAHLIYFRQPQLDQTTYTLWVGALLDKLSGLENKLMCQYLDMPFDFSVAGVHLSYAKAAELKRRPVDESKWLAVSCHNLEEISQSMQIGADFITLSPLKKTQSHPDQNPLEWQQFKNMLDAAQMPVYGLGGVDIEDEQALKDIGAQGIAGISFWVA